ncbi:MAG: helix-turn-helix domain-containing protein [Ferruginibacter sp.]|jgi:excisionase family DNA binding protein|nr:helix-turn-helix domain-containing protein [Ferruginibacter sp.]
MSSTIKLPKFCNHCGKAFIAQKTTTKYCGHKCNSAAYKKTKREEKVNAEFKNQQSKIVSPSPVVATETLPNPKSGNHTNLREKEFLSILEVATLLGASRWTIQRMIKSNRLPVAKLGSRTIIKRASIDNLFN